MVPKPKVKIDKKWETWLKTKVSVLSRFYITGIHCLCQHLCGPPWPLRSYKWKFDTKFHPDKSPFCKKKHYSILNKKPWSPKFLKLSINPLENRKYFRNLHIPCLCYDIFLTVKLTRIWFRFKYWYSCFSLRFLVIQIMYWTLAKSLQLTSFQTERFFVVKSDEATKDTHCFEAERL